MKGPFWHSIDPVRNHSDDPMWSVKFSHVLADVTYKNGYGLLLAKDRKDPQGRWYFQVECDREDSLTGEWDVGRGGKAYLSVHMTESELTRLVFGLFKAYEEHETREFFKWKGRRIFGPHIDSNALWEIAERYEVRESE